MKTAMSRAGKCRSSGFTYVMALVAIALVAITAATAAPMVSYQRQADLEAELLFRGQAYRNAIRSFYLAGVRAGRPAMFPRSLEDLVKDPRFAHKRHIRQLYKDPFAEGDSDWTLIRATDGGIAGVASRSTRTPLKVANFPVELAACEGATSYAEWRFEFKPEPATRPATQKSK